MRTAFQRLVRFANPEGKVFYGEAPALPDPAALVGKKVPIYQGANLWDKDFRVTTAQEEVKSVLCPLSSVPIFHCIGSNYRLHIAEIGGKAPAFPSCFNKPPDALAGPLEDIPIHKESSQLDYEGELCIVVGKAFKDLGPDDNPLDYALGYVVGNDVSSRYWQVPERSSHQGGYAKSFDKFAPIGPFIYSSSLIPDPGDLRLTTKANGQMRQDARTSDLLFDVSTIMRYISRGRTIREGTVIMTGTPSGVAAFMKPAPWLQPGDVVEIEIENIGIIRNKFV